MGQGRNAAASLGLERHAGTGRYLSFEAICDLLDHFGREVVGSCFIQHRALRRTAIISEP